MPCHAIDSTSIGRTDVTRVYCKDPSKRGERIIARSVSGRKEDGTLTINAWSQHQSDLLHRIWQKNCMFGAQTHLDVCGLPTDATAYTKILDYYAILPGTLDYANVDNLEGGEGAGLQLGLSTTYYTSIYGDLTERCASDCGADRDRCDVIFFTTNDVGGAAVARTYYSTDGGATFAQTGAAPFAHFFSIGGALIDGDRWIVFCNEASAGVVAQCSYSDNNGGAWTIVNMGGAAGVDFTVNSYRHDSGNIFAVGGEAGGPTGAVYHSHDRGVSWTRALLNTAQIFNDVATSDGDTVWAVGNSNSVERSTDGGHTWTALAAGPATAGIALRAVRALTPDHVIVGSDLDATSEQLHYTLNGTDAAPTWTGIPFTGSTAAGTGVIALSIAPQAFRQHLWMVQGNTGTTNSSYCFRSLDGGATWERWTLLTNQRYNDIFACDSNNAWIAADDDGAAANGQIFYASPV